MGREAVIRELVTYADGGMVSLANDSNTTTWLSCTCQRFRIRKHCKHIIHAMSDRVDAKYKSPGDRHHHMVPIFMTKSHPLTVPFEINVHRKGVEGEALYEVHVIVQGRPEYFLGYLTDSEGRVDIRTMFLDWLTGQVDQAYRVGDASLNYCKSPHHEGLADFLAGFDEADTPTMSKMLVDYWYFMTTGVCAACADISTIPI